MNFRTVFAALLVAAVVTPASAARPMYAGSDWSDIISKVNCKDVKQLPDGQWQLSADVSVGGSIKSDPIVSGTNADALKKKCSASQSMTGAH